MTHIGFSPSMQIIDVKTGYLTSDGAHLVNSIVIAMNGLTVGDGAVLTNDGIQTLTNKTIDGDTNTLQDIPTSALKTRTGTGAVATGAAGISGTLAQWDANGDLVEGPTAATIIATSLAVDGTVVMEGPLTLESYLVAGVPAAADYTGAIIYVSDEAGGGTLAISNGTSWYRMQDRAVIS